MKHFTNFRIFKKVVRKYWKQHAVKTIFKTNGKKYTSWWVGDNIWCYYLVNKQEELNSESIKQWFQYDVPDEEINEFINSVKRLINKHVDVTSSLKKKLDTGIFEGFALVNNGVLFLIKSDKDNSNNFYYLNCTLNEI